MINRYMNEKDLRQINEIYKGIKSGNPEDYNRFKTDAKGKISTNYDAFTPEDMATIDISPIVLQFTEDTKSDDEDEDDEGAAAIAVVSTVGAYNMITSGQEFDMPWLEQDETTDMKSCVIFIAKAIQKQYQVPSEYMYAAIVNGAGLVGVGDETLVLILTQVDNYEDFMSIAHEDVQRGPKLTAIIDRYTNVRDGDDIPIV